MNNKRRLLLLLFFLSGAAALIYEISWVRKLELIFGTTTYAVATVLAVFFAGLAVGSYLFGAFADKFSVKRDGARRLLVLFAILELGVAAYALLTPTLFKLFGPVQVSLAQSLGFSFSGFNLATLLLSFIALIIPSTLIGGTLPVIIKYFGQVQPGQVGKDTGVLYGINTIGAVVGAILAGFVLVFFLGINGTIYFAALINFLVGVSVFMLGKRVPRVKLSPLDVARGKHGSIVKKKTIQPSSHLDIKPKRLTIILLVFFFTGFAALALEVLWTRVLILAIGSTIYSFSIILASFILGIALGSLIISRYINHINPLSWLIGILFTLGLAVVATAAFLGSLPLIFFSFVRTFDVSSFLGAQVIGILLAFLVLLFPTLLMGATFPLGAKIYAQGMKDIGLRIGRLYSVNTVGGVIGSLVAGFLLLPFLGLQRSIAVAAVFYFAVSILLLLVFRKGKTVVFAIVLLSVAVITAGFIYSPWQKHILNSGLYLFLDYPEVVTQESVKEYLIESDLIYYKEGVTATVAVLDNGRVRHLKINGKTDAGSSNDDMPTQLLLGHIPMMLHTDPKSVLVIGLGSGVTLGAVEQYPAETIDAVEIEPAVFEAAEYFADFNNDALGDPRLRMITGDARNYLGVTEATYDVITSEPSNFWIQGSYSLFSKEFYELAKKRLNKRGVLMQWIHLYQTDTESLRVAIATLQSVFPYVSAWSSVPSYGDVMLVASEEPLQFEVKGIRDRFGNEKVKRDLARAGIQDVGDFLALLFLDYSGVEQLSKGAPLHSDDWPILGLKAPFSLYRFSEAIVENTSAMSLFRSGEAGEMFIFETAQQEEVFKRRQQARDFYNQGRALSRERKFEEKIQAYENALDLYPSNKRIKDALRSSYVSMAVKHEKEGNLERARYYVEKIKELKGKQ